MENINPVLILNVAAGVVGGVVCLWVLKHHFNKWLEKNEQKKKEALAKDLQHMVANSKREDYQVAIVKSCEDSSANAKNTRGRDWRFDEAATKAAEHHAETRSATVAKKRLVHQVRPGSPRAIPSQSRHSTHHHHYDTVHESVRHNDDIMERHSTPADSIPTCNDDSPAFDSSPVCDTTFD